jgi:hypothetical protein
MAWVRERDEGFENFYFMNSQANAIFTWALPMINCYRTNHPRRLDQIYFKETLH